VHKMGKTERSGLVGPRLYKLFPVL
jgi:hypothetical protein